MIKIMREKGLAPIVIVILIALGIGGYLIYQNQPKQTPSQQIPQPSPTTTYETQQSPFPPIESKEPKPIKDDLSDWVTYNSPCGFSFKYPPDYNVKHEITKCDGNTGKVEEGSVVSPDYGRTLWINMVVDTNVGSQDISTLLNSMNYTLEFPKNLRELTTILGKSAVRLPLQSNEQAGFKGGVDTVVGILNNGKFIIFKVKGDETTIFIWDKILSTFKFTE